MSDGLIVVISDVVIGGNPGDDFDNAFHWSRSALSLEPSQRDMPTLFMFIHTVSFALPTQSLFVLLLHSLDLAAL